MRNRAPPTRLRRRRTDACNAVSVRRLGRRPLQRSTLVRQISGAPSAESCIRKAVSERGFSSNLVGLADAKAEKEAASRWADCAVA